MLIHTCLVQLLNSNGHAATAPVAVTVEEYKFTYTTTNDAGQAVEVAETFASEITRLGFPATGETFGASLLFPPSVQTIVNTTVLACPPGTLMTGMSGPMYPLDSTVRLFELSVYCREGEWPATVLSRGCCFLESWSKLLLHLPQTALLMCQTARDISVHRSVKQRHDASLAVASPAAATPHLLVCHCRAAALQFATQRPAAGSEALLARAAPWQARINPTGY